VVPDCYTVPVLLYPISAASLPSHPLVMHECTYQCLKGKKENIHEYCCISMVVVITHGTSSLPIEALKSGEYDPL
jgi:hypothetical protein